MKKFITDLSLSGKKVIVRLDLNVPIDKKTGKITSLKRIKEAIPTINYVVENGGRAILMSHLGRVKTKEDRETKSLLPVATALADLLQKDIRFIDKTRGKRLESAIERLKDGEIILMENTRFEDLNDKAESKNDPELAKYWASLGDVFINDAFGTSHRSHASNVGIATYIPESAVGFLIKKEIVNLSEVLGQPQRPFVAIIGGAKVSDKILVLKSLIDNVDKLIIGGAMAYTFMKAQNIGVGNSMVEEDQVEFAREFLLNNQGKIVLPIDHALAKSFEDKQPQYNFDNPIEIPTTFMALDIGPETGKLITKYLNGDQELGIEAARTVFWNGPMGVTEFSNYKVGTQTVVNAISTLKNTFSVVGGGDSVAAIESLDAEKYFSHISTGGGASIEFIEGKPLVGIEAIQDLDAYSRKHVVEEQQIFEEEQSSEEASIDEYTSKLGDSTIAMTDENLFADLEAMSLPEVEPEPVVKEEELFVEETAPLPVQPSNEVVTNKDLSDIPTTELEESLLRDLEITNLMSEETPKEEVIEELVIEDHPEENIVVSEDSIDEFFNTSEDNLFEADTESETFEHFFEDVTEETELKPTTAELPVLESTDELLADTDEHAHHHEEHDHDHEHHHDEHDHEHSHEEHDHDHEGHVHEHLHEEEHGYDPLREEVLDETDQLFNDSLDEQESLEDSSELQEFIETSTQEYTGDSTESLFDDIEIDNETTQEEAPVKKVGFWKRLFGKK
ncbi:phosphoglycerate kinase [Mycoplasmopsis agassizii]|uniref:Phosphoglycerate kinase n=1 Tax=Mycoplasmopsis agassizii TaxID=33922 RepID=A0ABX4H5C5_9BACT|nr:phosphoglycerate kinase [Mycoplasmopsis agassizii]PAF55101.1 phosphoglycerate kinase [Mycoplasmopsis agassizii]